MILKDQLYRTIFQSPTSLRDSPVPVTQVRQKYGIKTSYLRLKNFLHKSMHQQTLDKLT